MHVEALELPIQGILGIHSLRVCCLFVNCYYNKKELEPQKVIASIQAVSSYESE
jgi:hypothetical protein